MAKSGSSENISILPVLVILVLSTLVIAYNFSSINLAAAQFGISDKKVNRQPASDSTGAVVVKYAKPQMVKFDCMKSQDKQEVSLEATHVQLHLNCRSQNFDADPITNVSNGFTAATIHLETGLTTDYIDLKEGQNEIKIGNKSLVINRKPASL